MAVKKGEPVYVQNHSQHGETTGVTRMCQLAGCGGLRVGVRWGDNRITWPCTKGMQYDETAHAWTIGL